MEQRGNWLQYQAYTGLMLSIFVGLHVVNHVLGTLNDSPEGHIQLMIYFRKVYQNFVVEIGFAIALVAHIYFGVRQSWKRHKFVPSTLPFSHKLHRYTSYILSMFMTAHLFATRIAPIIVLGYDKSTIVDITFTGMAIRHKPAMLYTIYPLLFACTIYHTVYGIIYSLNIINKVKQPVSNTAKWKILAVISLIIGIYVTYKTSTFQTSATNKEEFETVLQFIDGNWNYAVKDTI